jgi:ABC-type glycerol-3-phosphate transport system substrate-binding protein
MKNKKFLSLLLIVFFLAVSAIFSGCSQTPTAYSLELEVWGVFDNSNVFEEQIKYFTKTERRVAKVRYKKISDNAEEYERELVDAIASGKAPDIIYFKNSWLPKHKEKIAPYPASEQFLVENKDAFVDVFYTDFVEQTRDGKEVYAMPLFNDTLALYYNKDMFNQAGIPFPPKTWDEVKDYTKKLTKIDEFGNITQSAIALGRSKEPGAINRASDILLLLTMQNGANITEKKNVDFGRSSLSSVNPGLAALKFYTQFSQGDSEVYTWNTKMDYSIDSFRYRRLAMMVNYSYMYERLKRMDPKLNFDVAPVPQVSLDQKANYADYWGLAVVKNKEIPPKSGYDNDKRITQAWKFINFMANKHTKKYDANKIFLDKTNRTAARKDLLEEQKSEAFRGVFAEQAFTSQSWRRPDELGADQIIVDLIDDTINGRIDPAQGLRTAASRINVLW